VLALGTPLEVRRQAGGGDGAVASMEEAFIGIVQRARGVPAAVPA